jgi:hypothetical protein
MSAPRARGVGSPATGKTTPMARDQDRVRRDVRSDDPSLSPEANRRLSEELRDVLGRDEVEVPRDRPTSARERHATHSGFAVAVADHRDGLVVLGLALLVVGAVVWVATGSWIVMAIAVAADLLAGLLVAAMFIQLTTDLEHPSPELAAKLQSEGVADPDKLMTDLVHELAEEEPDGERATTAEEAPARATAEQRSAVTPTGHPSKPTGP